ncbi:MAG: hypothetical protein KAU14_05475, partial [Thermoplasmata archaeon]|nr:hypothetical protein [Thermoplasmata archaeon]
MNNSKTIFVVLVVALLFLVPPVSMLQNDSSPEGKSFPPRDESVSTNEQRVETTHEEEASPTGESPVQGPEVNVEGERSSKKFLDAFKLNFNPWNPEDGDAVNCSATVHNFGTERQIAYNVNVEFWA